MIKGPNIITNPSFETGDFSGWTVIENAQIFNEGYDGSYSAMIYGLYQTLNPPYKTTGKIQQVLNLEQGKIYRLVHALKEEQLESDFGILLDKGDGQEEVIYSQQNANHDWEIINYGYSFKALGTNGLLSFIKKWPDTEGSAASYVDYVLMEEVEFEKLFAELVNKDLIPEIVDKDLLCRIQDKSLLAHIENKDLQAKIIDKSLKGEINV